MLNNKRKVEIIMADIENLLDELTSEEKLEVLSKYCKYCGDKNPRCQCWNDD